MGRWDICRLSYLMYNIKKMIIEIGTSDFRTQAGKEDGIFIEPVKEHFDRLPDCKKENVAISNYEGTTKLYYVPTEKIKEMVLPDWIRGCSSIGSPHPTLLKWGLEKHIVCVEVPVVRIKSIIDKYKVSKIHLLKIDTEGHDTVILNDFLDTVDILPNKILFENNELSNRTEVLEIMKRLSNLGYKIKPVKTDLLCEYL